MADNIPLTNDARQTLRLMLGGQSVRLNVFWQPTDSAWYFDLIGQDGQPVIEGARITLNARLINSGVAEFTGDIVCQSMQAESHDEPGREAWANTHRLLYDAAL